MTNFEVSVTKKNGVFLQRLNRMKNNQLWHKKKQ